VNADRSPHLLLVRAAAAAVLLGSLVLAGPTAPVDAATGVPSRTASTVVKVPLRTAIRNLRVAVHSHAGSYDRTRAFGDWISQGGGCTTRAVVLKDETLEPTTQTSSCTVRTGRWYSFYDGRYYMNAYGGLVQIDHVVPTENAWVSGAWRWTHATRVRYYNDLGDSRALVAVDRHDNEAKGDRDPSDWMPSHGRCRYLRYWVAVKIRWRLSVSRGEKAALNRVAAGCTNPDITVRRAQVVLR
jgi:hypothetical protein